MLFDHAFALIGALALTIAAQSAGHPSASPGTPPDTGTPAQEEPSLDRAARAQFNLQALRAGTRSIGDLTAQELQDMIDLERTLRSEADDTRRPSQRCVDREVQRLGGSPSQLAWRVIDLKCRDVG